MENKKQEYIGKVKMRLTQPMIKCSGRDTVTCYYRGKLISFTDSVLEIEFKFNNETVVGVYDRLNEEWISATVDIGFIWDIKVYEIKK